MRLADITSKNPVFQLSLGLVPAVGITYLATNGLYLGIITTVVLVASLLVGSAIGPFVPRGARFFLHLTLVAVLTVLASRLLATSYPEVIVRMGIYFPLIAVNSLVLYCIAEKEQVSITRALGLGIGFTGALTLMGIVREFLAFGSVFGVTLFDVGIDFFALVATVPGGFIVLGLLMALFRALFDDKEVSST